MKKRWVVHAHVTNVPLEQRRPPSPAKTEVEQQMWTQSMSYRLQGIWHSDGWPFPVCFFLNGCTFRRRIVADYHGRPPRDAFRRLFWSRLGLLTILGLEHNLGLKNL